MSVRNPSSPGEWAAYYREEWKSVRGNRDHLEGLLVSVRKTIVEWEAVVAMERCPKGYRQGPVSLGGVPTDHDYWWATKQRPELKAEIDHLRTVEVKIEKDARKSR
jgi:hypothetical protein